MEVAKLSAPPNLEVRSVSCNQSAIKRWLSSELEETVFSLTNELFMTKHWTRTLKFTLHRACVLNNVVITTVIEMVEILDGRVGKRSVERVKYVINNLLHLVIVKY